MAIIKQTDKKTGITYAYETIYHWDTEKQQSRCKRTIVGKIDAETGEIVPTRGRSKKKLTNTQASENKTDPILET